MAICNNLLLIYQRPHYQMDHIILNLMELSLPPSLMFHTLTIFLLAYTHVLIQTVHSVLFLKTQKKLEHFVVNADLDIHLIKIHKLVSTMMLGYKLLVQL